MKLRERTRAYSLTMAVLNAGVAAFLFFLSRLNVSSSDPMWLVVLLGPPLTVLFVLVTIGWLVDSVRPSELGDILPKIRPGPVAKAPPGGDRDTDATPKGLHARLLDRGKPRA